MTTPIKLMGKPTELTDKPIGLTDTYGRTHTDLRISITDRCNFRCQYCMPEEGLEWLPKDDLLTFEEIFHIAELAVKRFGISSIRLTGGEPTLRAQLPKLVEMLATLNIDLAMTTNGVSLPKLSVPLKEAGLDRLNISLDSLNPEKFLELTRRDEMDRVIAGIEAAQAAGFSPVKINTVVMRSANDNEILDFVEFGRKTGTIIRFIEFMPLDADEGWSRDQVVGIDEILEIISAVHKIEPIDTPESSNAPASRFRYLDGLGEFGVIASVTQSFCHLCDRVRLTADGQFRSCLFSTSEYDLREILRSTENEIMEKYGKAKDDKLAELIAEAVFKKWAGHSIDKPHFIRPSRSMSQIGG